jgi:hypothetical protein
VIGHDVRPMARMRSHRRAPNTATSVMRRKNVGNVTTVSVRRMSAPSMPRP